MVVTVGVTGASTFWLNWPSETLVILLRAAFLGSLGAFLSVMIGLRTVELDIDDPMILKIVLGAMRILIGVIGSLVVSILVRADILFGLLPESEPLGLYALAFIAGFSETFVPKVLARIERSVEENTLPG